VFALKISNVPFINFF